MFRDVGLVHRAVRISNKLLKFPDRLDFFLFIHFHCCLLLHFTFFDI